MNLRDLINEKSSVENLDVLLEKEFDIDEKDALLMSVVGEKHRAEQEHELAAYDYSPESKIYLSFCYHLLKKKRILKPTLDNFESFIKYKTEGYIKAPNSQSSVKPKGFEHTYAEIEERLKDMLMGIEWSNIISEKLEWAGEYTCYKYKQCFGKATGTTYKHPVLGLIGKYKFRFTKKDFGHGYDVIKAVTGSVINSFKKKAR